MYRELQKPYGTPRTDGIMGEIVMKGGRALFRGFTPLEPDAELRGFARIYKDFERHNVVFDVVEESEADPRS